VCVCVYMYALVTSESNGYGPNTPHVVSKTCLLVMLGRYLGVCACVSHTYAQMQTHNQTNTHTHICTYTHTQTHLHAGADEEQKATLHLFVCVRACVRVRVCVFVCAYV
jgi:hypothetical protein